MNFKEAGMAGKQKKQRAEKKTDVDIFEAIHDALATRNYYFTTHALERSKQRRNVSELQVINILKGKTKYHEPGKDSYNEKYDAWNYSIRGTSIDSENIRVILSFNENDMLIITVINLDE